MILMEVLLYDPARAETRIEFGMAEAEYAKRVQWRACAEMFRAIDGILRESAAYPEALIDEQMLRGGATELAVSAAVADLAVRLSLSESTVRTYAANATTLRERLPRLWIAFLAGEVSPSNVREAASLVVALPDTTWAEFDARLAEVLALAPARFRAKARALSRRLYDDPERLKRARSERGVWFEHDHDGMSWLNARLPSEALALASARLDAAAFERYRDVTETRSMAQLRADTLVNWLLGTGGTPSASVSVALTVPMLTLLGAGNEAAVLEGVGPIDIETARRLAAAAPSVTRLLTEPVTGAVLAMDTKQYRPTAALRRWLRHRDVTCTFSGCGRAAASCDIDHVTAWADGGATRADNLAHLCRKHHTLKHQTRWNVERDAGGATTWVSPTGYRRGADPPPY